MTEIEFLKHVYYTRNYIIIPALGRAKLDKKDFLNKKGYLDNDKLNNHLKNIYKQKFKK